MTAGSVAIVSVIYMMYPEPQLTTKLLQWKNGGQFLHFKGFQIFYKGKYIKFGTYVKLSDEASKNIHDCIV